MFFVFSKSFWPIIVWQLFYFGCKKGIFFARDWAVFWRVVLKKGICTFQVHKLVLFKYLRPNWITIHFFFHYYSFFLWYQKRAGLLNDDDFFFQIIFHFIFSQLFFFFSGSDGFFLAVENSFNFISINFIS